MTTANKKSERIDIRTSSAAKDTLQRAATIANKNVSEFLLDAGMAAAMEALADRRIFTLDDKTWKAFQQALDRPVRPLPRLKKLLSKPSVLE